MRRFFARPAVPLSTALRTERQDGILHWRKLTFAAGSGVEAIATVAVPTAATITRGVILAHGGSDDGRRFFEAEAAALAAQGAAVILPATRIRQSDGVDAFAANLRTAVWTHRAALDVLIEAGAPPDALSFLGHSAGCAQGAILSAVESRLARIAIFGNGAGSWARSALARGLSGCHTRTEDLNRITDWFDLAHFVGVHRRAPLLIQHGRADHLVPMEAGKALFDAAAEPRLWAEYNCGHDLDADPQARKDRAGFVMNPFPR